MLCVVGHRCCAEDRTGVQNSGLEYWRGRCSRCCAEHRIGVRNSGSYIHADTYIHLYTPIYIHIHPYTPIYIVLICVDDIC